MSQRSDWDRFNDQFRETEDERNERLAARRKARALEERQGSPIFRDHNCWKCLDGKVPCVRGNPSQCEYPHAKND